VASDNGASGVLISLLFFINQPCRLYCRVNVWSGKIDILYRPSVGDSRSKIGKRTSMVRWESTCVTVFPRGFWILAPVPHEAAGTTKASLRRKKDLVKIRIKIYILKENTMGNADGVYIQLSWIISTSQISSWYFGHLLRLNYILRSYRLCFSPNNFGVTFVSKILMGFMAVEL